MMRAETVNELIYNFTQAVFRKRVKVLKKEPLKRAHEEALFKRLSSGDSLTTNEVAGMPRRQQKLLYELLTQYIMFFQLNPELQFPNDFLDDSYNDELGVQILAYIAQHTWPYPQTLPGKSLH